MTIEKKGSAAGEILAFSLASVVLFRFSLFLLIFVIPLAVLYRRRGFFPGLIGSLVAFAGIAGMKIYHMASIQGAVFRPDLLGIDLVVPGTFLLGLAVMEAPELKSLRAYQRLLVAAVLAGIAGLPLLRYVMTSPEFDMILRAQIQAMVRSLTEGQAAGADLPFTGTEEVVRLSRIVFLNTYLAGYFMTLAANWVIGVRLSMRIAGESGEFPPFTRFRLPDAAVWAFLLFWTVVFLSFFRDLGIVRMLAWNLGLIAAILYGCQGVGIIKIWTAVLPRGTRLALTFLLVTLVFVPGINVILIAGVPLLGVSELWVNYRTKERS